MTARQQATSAPAPLEAYAEGLDARLGQRNQREGFRRYREALLVPAEWTKTRTALVKAGHPIPTLLHSRWLVRLSSGPSACCG